MDPLRPRRRAPSIEALEPRLLFSGDAAGAAVGEAVAWAASAAASAADAAVAWTAPAETDVARQAAAPRELAVVDTRVPDVGRLLAGLDAQRMAGRPIDVLVLGAGEDALQVLASELAAADSPYRAVHFFGHGSAGSMQLGGTSLDLATVRANAGPIAGWSAGLCADADLLLWGCDTGAGAAGPALLEALADLTGADVAASDDATGGLAHGADWTLEVARGAIETQAPIDAALQASFAGVLAAEAPTAVPAAAVPADSGGRQIAGHAQAGSGSVAVWVDALSNDVVAQRYDAAGVATGAAITVSTGDGSTPAVAMDTDGGDFIVVWQDGTGPFGQILAQRYLADGTASGPRLQLTADATDDPRQPAVAMNASGEAVVVWAQEVGPGGSRSVDVVYRRISASGVPGGAIEDLVKPGDRSGVQIRPAVAMQDDGGFGVAFMDSADGGSAWVVVVPDASDDNNGKKPERISPIGAVVTAAPSIATLADGRYVAAWSGSSAPAAAIVQAVLVDGDTGAPGTVFQVSDAPVNVAAWRPSVAVAPGGAGDTIVVVWHQDEGGGGDIRARAFDLAGTPKHGSVAVNTLTAGAQRHVSAAIVGGMLRVAWTGPSTDTVPVEQTWVRTMSVPAQDIAVTWPTTAATSESDGATGGRTVQVALAVPPAGTVTVRVTVIHGVAGADEAVVDGGLLTFDATNWDQPQTVTIRGRDELRTLRDGDQAYTVRVAIDAAGSIASWHGVAAQDKAFVNQDDDAYSVFEVTTNLDVDDVARAPGDPLTPYALWLHAQAGNAVSLREALLAANHQAEAPGSRDRIQFALAPGSERIVLGAMLPSIVHAVEIDGGAPAVPGGPLRVELTRSLSAGGGNGLELGVGSDGSRIAHLAIGGFTSNAIRIQSSDNRIEGNHLGVDASGTGAFGNGERGLSLWDDVDAVAVARNVIRDNVIGSNGQGGIRILGGNASENLVQGNFIGTDRSRVLDLGNGDDPGVDPFGYGILLTNGAHDNVIGGTVAGEENVLRHNGDFGIVLGTSSSRDNALLANVIDADLTPIHRLTEGRAVPTPVLSDARPGTSAGQTLVDVTLVGTAFAYFRLDFYVDRTAFAPGSPASVDAQTWIGGVSTRVVQLGSNGRWSGTVTLTTTADYAMAVVATATATDAAVPVPAYGETSALSVATRVNQVPVFQATSNLSVNENTNPAVTSGPYLVGTLRANDPDVSNGPLVWSLVGGDDRADFSIDAATGVLSFDFPPDHENPQDANATHPTFHNTYEVIVRVVDVMGGQSDRRYVVTVVNQNERPTLVLPTAAVPATEDRSVTLRNATAVSVRDPDRVSSMQRIVVELSVDRGTLELDDELDDVDFREGTSRVGARIVIRGDLDDIQDALERIDYRPAADDFGTARLTVTVSDRDNAALSSTGTVEIAIAAVNDAPVVGTAPPSAPISLGATGALALDATLLGSTDVDHGAAQVVYTMRAAPAAGRLLRDGVEIGVDGTFTQADVDAGRMRFLAPTQGGLQQLSLEVRDASGASAAYGPVVLKLAIESLAAAAPPTAPAASTAAPASAPAAASSASAPASASSSGGGGSAATQAATQVTTQADAGTSSGVDAGAGSRSGSTASSAAGAQSTVARAGATPSAGGAAAAAVPGATTLAGAIATQAGGAELQAARQDGSGGSRDATGAGLQGAAAAAALAPGQDASDRDRGALSGSGSAALADAWRRAGTLQAAEAAAEIQQAWSPVVALRQADFREELAQSREEAASTFQASSALVASSVAISTSLSLGYAIWLLRGGVLLTSLLASMPAWRSIDPLPVLARIDARGQDDDGEDDSLRGLLQRAADEQAERVAEAEALADGTAVPAGRLAEEVS